MYTSEVGDGGLQMTDTFSYKCTQCRIGEQFELRNGLLLFVFRE